MPSDGDSFLPRIQSVFYSIFDNQHGPKIVYQVPEALIATTPSPSSISVPPTPATDAPPSPRLSSRNSSSSLISPVENRALLSLNSPNKRSTSSNRVLFNFDDISKYVIPPSPLCGRLVICSTKHHRIIGFPVELRGPYERNYFRYNLCFVFDRGADLSCYEPIVRKVSRVLTSCEVRFCAYSLPDTESFLRRKNPRFCPRLRLHIPFTRFWNSYTRISILMPKRPSQLTSSTPLS